MTLPLVLLNRRRIGGFNPRAILAGSTAFLWLDPSDLTTLYQDAAGTTPVTAAGQPVGLVLDKSGNGFHATQSTAANRPTYGVVPSRGRVNLLTYTEDFGNAVWQKFSGVSVAAGTVTAPDGTSTAQRLNFPSVTDAERFQQAITVPAGGGRFEVWMRGSGQVRLADTNMGVETLFTLTSSWTKYAITGTRTAGSTTIRIIWRTGDTAITNLEVWHPQAELDSTATPYQRVVSQFDVTDPAGFPSYPLHYLFFGGDLDPRWLQTPTITPNADKVQVFAGVRKLSDAAQGCLVELGVSATNGSISLWSPPYANGGFAFWSKGTALSSNAFTATPLSPVTQVIAGLGEISTDTAVLRLNGVQSATSSQDQGTGNYLAYPIFIGRRGGTTFPLNGQLYGLIVRFSTANLDASVIAQTERWLAQKTGVTI